MREALAPLGARVNLSNGGLSPFRSPSKAVRSPMAARRRPEPTAGSEQRAGGVRKSLFGP